MENFEWNEETLTFFRWTSILELFHFMNMQNPIENWYASWFNSTFVVVIHNDLVTVTESISIIQNGKICNSCLHVYLLWNEKQMFLHRNIEFNNKENEKQNQKTHRDRNVMQLLIQLGSVVCIVFSLSVSQIDPYINMKTYWFGWNVQKHINCQLNIDSIGWMKKFERFEWNESICSF